HVLRQAAGKNWWIALLALWLESIPETSERTFPFRHIRQVKRHVEPHAGIPMSTDDFLVRIIHRVERDRGHGAYFQTAFSALDSFAELIVERVVTAENPHVRVAI